MDRRPSRPEDDDDDDDDDVEDDNDGGSLPRENDGDRIVGRRPPPPPRDDDDVEEDGPPLLSEAATTMSPMPRAMVAPKMRWRARCLFILLYLVWCWWHRGPPLPLFVPSFFKNVFWGLASTVFGLLWVEVLLRRMVDAPAAITIET
jgi:hypothetical protein